MVNAVKHPLFSHWTRRNRVMFLFDNVNIFLRYMHSGASQQVGMGML